MDAQTTLETYIRNGGLLKQQYFLKAFQVVSMCSQGWEPMAGWSHSFCGFKHHPYAIHSQTYDPSHGSDSQLCFQSWHLSLIHSIHFWLVLALVLVQAFQLWMRTPWITHTTTQEHIKLLIAIHFSPIMPLPPHQAFRQAANITTVAQFYYILPCDKYCA